MDTATLNYLCSGNTAAVAFIRDMWQFAQTWDNIVDRDKGHDEDAINAAFIWALFGLQDNPFYQSNLIALRAAIMQGIASWRVANKFERSKEPGRVEQAYFMRCAPYDVFCTAVLLASGPAKHLEAVEYFRALAPDDSLQKYMAEHLSEGA